MVDTTSSSKEEGGPMRWSVGNRAVVKKNHPWNGKSVIISSMLPGLVVCVEDNDGNSTIINVNHLMKPQERRERGW